MNTVPNVAVVKLPRLVGSAEAAQVFVAAAEPTYGCEFIIDVRELKSASPSFVYELDTAICAWEPAGVYLSHSHPDFPDLPTKVVPVPNKPKTPIRGVRVPDDEWRPAQAKAKDEGETVTDVVRRALRDYVEEKR